MSPIVDVSKGFRLVFRGESYWLDIDARSQRVTIDLQHHGMMGQPGDVERVGEGVWEGDAIKERKGVLEGDVFDAAEGALRAHVAEGRGKN